MLLVKRICLRSFARIFISFRPFIIINYLFYCPEIEMCRSSNFWPGCSFLIHIYNKLNPILLGQISNESNNKYLPNRLIVVIIQCIVP
jgi:hypothetical protein